MTAEPATRDSIREVLHVLIDELSTLPYDPDAELAHSLVDDLYDLAGGEE